MIRRRINNAVINAANNGIRFVIAAGNAAQNADNTTPARVDHQNVWTVSAFRQGDEFVVDFNCPINNKGSNFGNPPVDYSAGGEDVASLLIGGGRGNGYGTYPDCANDGTSYAAPVVAGLLLAAPNSLMINGYVSGDPDGTSDTILVYDVPVTVTISGPNNLHGGELGTWQANLSNGDGSYNYQWYYRNGDYLEPWIADGTNSPTYSHRFILQNYPETTAVKVVVSDNDEQASNIIFIFVQDPNCPPGQLC